MSCRFSIAEAAITHFVIPIRFLRRTEVVHMIVFIDLYPTIADFVTNKRTALDFLVSYNCSRTLSHSPPYRPTTSQHKQTPRRITVPVGEDAGYPSSACTRVDDPYNTLLWWKPAKFIRDKSL